MIYSVQQAAIARRDSLISGLRDSQEWFAGAINRQHEGITGWLRWQIEKRETRLDTIGLVEKAGGDSLSAEAAKTAGEADAFRAVLAYIENGWKAD